MVLLWPEVAMAAYSLDLRQRVIRACDRGQALAAVAEQFDVSLAWIYRLLQRRRETGSIHPRKQTKFRGRALSRDQEVRLVALITARPDATLAELQHALPTRAGLTSPRRAVGGSTRSRCTTRVPTSSLTSPASPRISCVVTVGARGQRLSGLHAVRPLADPHGGRRPARPRTHRHRRVRWPHRQSDVPRLRRTGPGPDAATPAMWLSSTTWRCTNNRVQAAIEQAGARLRFLPPYSPDFNKIELAFAKLKALMRAARPRKFDQVVELVSITLEMLSPLECLRHCGYRVPTAL